MSFLAIRYGAVHILCNNAGVGGDFVALCYRSARVD